jgi:hypothetical protein
MVTRGAVAELLSKRQTITKITQVLVTSRATWATAARWNETEYNVVAHCEPTHAFANFLNDAGAFMATDKWQFKWQVASEQMFI